MRRGPFLVVVAALSALVLSIAALFIARSAHSVDRNVALLIAKAAHPMQDFALVQRTTDGKWFAIGRLVNEGADDFAQRVNQITVGAVDVSNPETHLCAELTGCDEGRNVTLCVAILPNSNPASNQAALDDLRAAVCAEIHCTGGCQQ